MKSVIGNKNYRIGVWWDINSKNTFKHINNHLNTLLETGITDVYIFINSVSDLEFKYSNGWTPKNIKKFADVLKQNGIDVSITLWVFPIEDYINQVIKEISQLANYVKPRTIEFDVEGNWSTKYLSGFESLENAAYYLITQLTAKLNDVDKINIAGTTHTGRINPTFMRFVDEANIQCYSVWGSKKIREYNIGGIYGPGKRQALGFRKMKDRVSDKQKISFGLAAWAQKFPQVEPEEAMDMAVVECMNYYPYVSEIRYWSYKWIGGHDGDGGKGYAINYLKALNNSRTGERRIQQRFEAPVNKLKVFFDRIFRRKKNG